VLPSKLIVTLALSKRVTGINHKERIGRDTSKWLGILHINSARSATLF